MDDIPGFSLPGSSNNNDVGGSFKLQKKTKKGGGFQAMGLSFHLLKGITKRGYKIPTPIQRKVSNFKDYLCVILCYPNSTKHLTIS